MSNKNIPKFKYAPPQARIKTGIIYAEDKVTFSFAALERTEHFNLDATCPNWSSELFNMLKTASTYTKADLISGKVKTYRVHNHENANPPDALPDGVALKDCYQIRISKSKGGIHGVFNESVFYVIWLDPLHNMYPSDMYGGLRIIKPPKTCCRDAEERIAELKGQLAKEKEERELWENECARLCASDNGISVCSDNSF